VKKRIFNEIRELPEFKKDFKKLSKRFPTLKEDLQVFIDKQLNLFHKLNIDNKGVFQISGLKINYPKIYKARKFACKSLKGKGAFSENGMKNKGRDLLKKKNILTSL